jgi:two-component system cell cycle sensor histidine kinase PleC
VGFANAQRAAAKPGAQDNLTPDLLPALDCLRIAVTMYDAHEKLTYANQHFDYLFRAMPPRAQLHGLRYDEIVRLEIEAGELAPSALEAGVDPFVASRRGQLTAGDFRPMDVHLVDGRIIEIKSRPIKSGGWIALWSDVTAARHAIWRLENAMEMAADAFAFFDRHDALVMCNMEFAHIYGRSVDEMRGCTFDALITGLVRQGRINTGGEDDKWIARRLGLHHTPAGAMTVETNDGTAYLVRDRKTRDGGRVSVLTDITNERHTERALAEQTSTLTNTREALARSKDEAARQSRYLADLTQRMDAAAAEADTSKKTMLRTMSHELKTPLNAIIGFSDLLQQFADGFGPEQVKEYAGLIHSGGHNLLRLINQILDLTKIAGGKFELARSRVDAGGAMWSAGEQWRERAAAKEITIDSEGCASGNVVDADEGALGQIINNLLSNAVAYTPRGGRVTLKTTCSDGFVTISVADNGPGVEKADLARILQPFEQARHGGADHSNGAGLGLTLTKTLVELHGGRLEIASSGEGFTATVHLPLAE